MSNHGPQVELHDDAEDEWGNGAVQSTTSALLEFKKGGKPVAAIPTHRGRGSNRRGVAGAGGSTLTGKVAGTKRCLHPVATDAADDESESEPPAHVMPAPAYLAASSSRDLHHTPSAKLLPLGVFIARIQLNSSS